MNAIERLEKLLEDAPPMPWKRDQGCWPDYIVDACDRNVAAEVEMQDADFIVAAVNALPNFVKLARTVFVHRFDVPDSVWLALEPLIREVRK